MSKLEGWRGNQNHQIIRQSNLLPLHVQSSILALVIAIHHRVPSFENAGSRLHCWSLFCCSRLAFLLLRLLLHCSRLCLHHWGRSGCSSGTGWRSLEKGNSFMLTNYPKKCTPSVEQSGEGVWQLEVSLQKHEARLGGGHWRQALIPSGGGIAHVVNNPSRLLERWIFHFCMIPSEKGEPTMPGATPAWGGAR